MVRKADITISLPVELLEFWKRQCKTRAVSRSAWLARLIADWRLTEIEPTSHDIRRPRLRHSPGKSQVRTAVPSRPVANNSELAQKLAELDDDEASN